MNSPRAKPAVPNGRFAARRAFVVQFDAAAADRPSEPISGRVENIATGEQSLFDSLNELENFMRRELRRPGGDGWPN